MTSNDRGCVKTHRADAPSNIDLSERSEFDYFSLRKGKRTPETETALRFYTTSATTGRSSKAAGRAYHVRSLVRLDLALQLAILRYMSIAMLNIFFEFISNDTIHFKCLTVDTSTFDHATHSGGDREAGFN